MKKTIKTMSPQLAYLFISIPILAAISWSIVYNPLYTTYHGYDFWEHSAAIREWTKNLWHPGNPHLAIDTGSPRYMPFFFLLTVLAKIFDLNPIQALGIGGVMTMILFLYGIWLFLSLYFKNDWAPFVGLIVFLSGWGAGWYWSNCYQLRCLFYIITYPSSFVFSVSFIAFWLITKILRQGGNTIWGLIFLGIMSAIMLLCHPLTGAFVIGSLCLLALFEPNVSFLNRCKIIGAVLTGVLAAELWPYFSVWRIILGTSGGKAESWIERGNIIASRIVGLYHMHPFYNPKEFFVVLGPSFLGIPVLLYMACKREHLFIISGFILMSLPFVANFFFPIPLGHRFLFYTIFYLHLALIWYILRMQSKIRNAIHQGKFVRSAKITKAALYSFITLCLLWNIGLATLEFADYGLLPNLKFGRIKRGPIVEDMRRIRHFIPDESIVMSPIRTSWPLPTFTGKVLALFHINPMVEDHHQRLKDTERFFQVETTQESRLKILRQYKVTHILFEQKNIPETVIKNLNDFGSVAGKVDGYVIIKMRNDL